MFLAFIAFAIIFINSAVCDDCAFAWYQGAYYSGARIPASGWTGIGRWEIRESIDNTMSSWKLAAAPGAVCSVILYNYDGAPIDGNGGAAKGTVDNRGGSSWRIMGKSTMVHDNKIESYKVFKANANSGSVVPDNIPEFVLEELPDNDYPNLLNNKPSSDVTLESALFEGYVIGVFSTLFILMIGMVLVCVSSRLKFNSKRSHYYNQVSGATTTDDDTIAINK